MDYTVGRFSLVEKELLLFCTILTERKIEVVVKVLVVETLGHLYNYRHFIASGEEHGLTLSLRFYVIAQQK